MHKYTSKYSEAYRLALELFMRKGIHVDVEALEMELKAENETPKESRDNHSTPYYIWRTQRDNRVRSRHAEHEGKIYSWDDPPEGGHPGEDYNCRCWAEAMPHISFEEYNQFLKPKQDYWLNQFATSKFWNNETMFNYYYYGNGKPVTLEQMGHLDLIKSYYKKHYLGRFERQIFAKARTMNDGAIKDDFDTSYDFEDALYSHGGARVAGKFEGKITTLPSGERIIEGTGNFTFSDEYTDITSLREKWLKNRGLFGFESRITENDLPEWFVTFTEFSGTRYKISGNWDKHLIIRQRE